MTRKFLIICATFLALGMVFTMPVSAQFAGSNKDNYYCVEYENYFSGLTVIETDSGNYVCAYTSNEDGKIVFRNAIPLPPTLQQVQIWFIRIIYVLWAVSGVIFSFILMYIGFEYMTSFGNIVAQADAIKRFRRWLIGLALIFLSYPALNTMFNVLPINTNVGCFENLVDSTPGFQIFFPEVCGVTEEEVQDSNPNIGGGVQQAP